MSQEIGIVREIARWWRVYQLERYCLLTAAWLHKKGEFEALVTQFFETNPDVPAWIEEAGAAFLEFISARADETSASLARFEHALIAVKRLETAEEIVVEWPVNPYSVLSQIFNPEITLEKGRFQTLLSARYEGYFKVFSIE